MSVPNDTLLESGEVETSPGAWTLWTSQAVPNSAVHPSGYDSLDRRYYAAAYSPVYTWYGCGPAYLYYNGGTC